MKSVIDYVSLPRSEAPPLFLSPPFSQPLCTLTKTLLSREISLGKLLLSGCSSPLTTGVSTIRGASPSLILNKTNKQTNNKQTLLSSLLFLLFSFLFSCCGTGRHTSLCRNRFLRGVSVFRLGISKNRPAPPEREDSAKLCTGFRHALQTHHHEHTLQCKAIILSHLFLSHAPPSTPHRKNRHHEPEHRTSGAAGNAPPALAKILKANNNAHPVIVVCWRPHCSLVDPHCALLHCRLNT